MKKTLFAFSAIAVLLGFTACTSDEIVEPQVSDKTITISASTESNATRTALADDGEGGYDVVWSTGDVITIGDKTFTLSSTPGTTKGTFTGKDPANGKFDVWYGISSASLPAMQTYKAGEITNSPMHASVDITDGVASIVDFKNLCGLFKLSLKGTATVKSITISANEPVAGEFTVGTDGGAVLEESADDKSITLDCGDGVTLTESATDFFIAMPAGTYTGVSITLTDDAGKVCVKKLSSTKNLVITRSAITPASFTASTFKPTITASSPVGTIGMLDGKEAIVVELPVYKMGEGVYQYTAIVDETKPSFKVAIALQNEVSVTADGIYNDAEGHSFYTHSKANGLFGEDQETTNNGWRLPTKTELYGLELKNDVKTSNTVYKFGDNSVEFPKLGTYVKDYEGTIRTLDNLWGKYWSSTIENSGSKGWYIQIGNGSTSQVCSKTIYEYDEEQEFYSVRLFHAMPAAPTYNEGDKVEFSGHKGIVVDLGGDLGKVIVATMNVGATTVNDARCSDFYLTYANACAAIWSGWRLPTLEEFEALCLPESKGICGNTQVGEHYVPMMMWDLNNNGEIDLYLPLYDKDEEEGMYPFDKYWTGTTDDGGNTYYYFAPAIDWEDNYDPMGVCYKRDEADKTNEYLVRLFHDLQ